jgi:hypothetical protein
MYSFLRMFRREMGKRNLKDIAAPPGAISFGSAGRARELGDSKKVIPRVSEIGVAITGWKDTKLKQYVKLGTKCEMYLCLLRRFPNSRGHPRITVTSMTWMTMSSMTWY